MGVPLALTFPWVPFWFALLVAGVFGFVVGRWWIVVASFAWTYYGAHTSNIRLEGNLDTILAVLTTVLVAVAIELGVGARWLANRAWRRRGTSAQ